MPGQVVDWDLATAVGRRWAPGGPQVDPAEAAEAVAALHDLAAYAVGPVREITGLDADQAGSPTSVVDRRTWVGHNVEGFQALLGASIERLGSSAPAAVTAVGSRITGAELGAVLAFLSSKVLGQYEPFGPTGRLMLVAPNVVEVERLLDVVPHDFRLWVCLHEQTHRAQFGGVPWLADHLRGQVRSFLESSDLSLGELLRRAAAAMGAVAGSVRGRGGSLVDAVQSPEQRATLERITGVMSLLEGHSDWVMDEAGPQVVPTVATIRARFDRRRANPGTLDGIVRTVLGMDAKLAQYTQGAAFVRGVVSRVGPEGFAAVWAAPENLPGRAEITDPGAWCDRVVA